MSVRVVCPECGLQYSSRRRLDLAPNPVRCYRCTSVVVVERDSATQVAATNAVIAGREAPQAIGG